MKKTLYPMTYTYRLKNSYSLACSLCHADNPLCSTTQLFAPLGFEQLLLKHNADSNAKTKKGATPLHIAKEMGFKDIAHLLRDYRQKKLQ